MTKRILFIFIMLLWFMLSGCNSSLQEFETVNQGAVRHGQETDSSASASEPIAEEVTMHVKEESLSPIGVTLELVNHTEWAYLYGEPFWLERRNEAYWETVEPVIQNYGFVDIGYFLPGNETAEIHVDWEWIYGELPPGEYRIVKEYSYLRAPGDYDTYLLTAEFNII